MQPPIPSFSCFHFQMFVVPLSPLSIVVPFLTIGVRFRLVVLHEPTTMFYLAHISTLFSKRVFRFHREQEHRHVEHEAQNQFWPSREYK